MEQTKSGYSTNCILLLYRRPPANSSSSSSSSGPLSAPVGASPPPLAVTSPSPEGVALGTDFSVFPDNRPPGTLRSRASFVNWKGG